MEVVLVLVLVLVLDLPGSDYDYEDDDEDDALRIYPKPGWAMGLSPISVTPRD